MAKNIVIAEGTQGKTFTGVSKIRTTKQGGGSLNWVPEDEAGNYVTLKTKRIRENGTYTAAADKATGYKSVEVSVSPKVKSQSFEYNGTYQAADYDVDGFSQVRINVKGGSDVKLKSKKIIYNGTYKAEDDGADGFSSVSVLVSGTVSDIGDLRYLMKGFDLDVNHGAMNGGD